VTAEIQAPKLGALQVGQHKENGDLSQIRIRISVIYGNHLLKYNCTGSQDLQENNRTCTRVSL
jgi:hypothetical protein